MCAKIGYVKNIFMVLTIHIKQDKVGQGFLFSQIFISILLLDLPISKKKNVYSQTRH